MFKWKIHWFIPTTRLGFVSQVAAVSKWINEHRDAAYTSFPTKTFVYNKRYDLYSFVLNSKLQHVAFDYLEFGVSQGHSFKWWIENSLNENTRFFGFDSFDGLPEDWGVFKKGAMSTEGKPPSFNDSRHTFYTGSFEKTLLGFIAQYNPQKPKVIHLDADLYSSTLFVLNALSKCLSAGDILIFDEFNVPEHEFKAFTEWTQTRNISYSLLAEVNNYHQVAIMIE